MFIDASGDADLCHRAGLPTYLPAHIQPPTACARFSGWKDEEIITRLVMKHGRAFGLPECFIWGAAIPPDENVFMLSGTRVAVKNPAEADQLTYCEIEGRRQVRAIMDICRKFAPDRNIALQALPSQIGLRESRHIFGLTRIEANRLLCGQYGEDAIANGTYPVDVHRQDDPGITFKYLDGTQRYCRPGRKPLKGRWRKKSDDCPKFYRIPLRALIPKKAKNIIAAGRMLDADREAFGAVRVMVNLNQTGEAAGVAAWHALDAGIEITKINPTLVRRTLAAGGSIML